MIDEVLKATLARGYDARAQVREGRGLSGFKLRELERFHGRLVERGLSRVLEIGAGPGHAAAWLAERGMAVVATDLSPEHVSLCRAKGLDARVMSFDELQFEDGAFDALVAMSCLLHVPKAAWPGVLDEVHRVVKPGGLVYVGVHGGIDFEGALEGDEYDPPRFYASFTDGSLLELLIARFELWDFCREEYGDKSHGPHTHYQSVIVRRSES